MCSYYREGLLQEKSIQQARAKVSVPILSKQQSALRWVVVVFTSVQWSTELKSPFLELKPVFPVTSHTRTKDLGNAFNPNYNQL